MTDKGEMPVKHVTKILLVIGLVILTAVVSVGLTLYLTAMPASRVETDTVKAKMDEIGSYLEAYFIDEYDPAVVAAAAADGAAAAMIEATGDPWSYYISAEEMESHVEQMENSYVGVGVTIQMVDLGVEITEVTKGGPADGAGIRPGDIVTHVEGQSTVELGISGTQDMVRGEVGTDVHFTVLRGTEVLELDLIRTSIIAVVAEGRLLEGNIGYITIDNFDQHCAAQTLTCMQSLLDQGAEALLFDVRFNGGGLKTEMVQILDVLLPKGPLFRSVDYAGQEEVVMSDASCLSIPMAVLINEDSYSAAEFFAAALQEYGAAEIVGTQTTGKGNFQYTLPLSDGSAAVLSAGKYCTPNGVSLSDIGVTPDVAVDLEYEDYVSLYYGTLEQDDDAQLQAAVEVLLTKIS